MASSIFAVLRDVTKLAATAADDLASQSAKLVGAAADDLASQSAKLVGAADDIATMSGKAAANSASVAGDDLAVGAGQLSGVAPNRELPALWRIVKGSAVNKVVLGAILLTIDAFAPMLVFVLLCLGALYLAYESGESLLEAWQRRRGVHVAEDDSSLVNASEDAKVRAAIRTDVVLSFEMLVIALSTVAPDAGLLLKTGVLALVGVLMTVGVYGLIGVIIRLDDMGFALARSSRPWLRALGLKMAAAAPKVLQVLEPLGVFAMMMVAGEILVHQLVHLPAMHWAASLLLNTAFGAVVGLMLAGAHHLIDHWRRK